MFLPRFEWLQVMHASPKAMAGRILQSFNNLETNAGRAVDRL